MGHRIVFLSSGNAQLITPKSEDISLTNNQFEILVWVLRGILYRVIVLYQDVGFTALIER